MNSRQSSSEDIWQELNELRAAIESLEKRIKRLELESSAVSTPPDADHPEHVPERYPEESHTPSLALEQRIGEYWFAQLGIVILIIGLFFLISFAFNEFPPFWQVVVGYGISLAMYGLYRSWPEQYKLISTILLPGTLLLLYFVTFRLYFFHENPIISHKSLVLTALLIILVIQVYFALKENSQWLAFLPVILGFLTALLSDTHQFALLMILADTILIGLLLAIRHWQILGVSGIVLTYAAFLLYLLNNPLLGKQLQILPEHDWMIVYLLGSLIVYTLVSFRPRINEYLTRTTRILLTTLNSSGFYLVSLLLTFHFFRQNLASWNFVFAAVLFVIALAHWTIRRSKYSTSFYASFSYIALTVGILAASSVPYTYLWLAWQSALVIGTAIWFRSGIIVWANTGIYLLVLLVYLLVGDPVGPVNFNFVAVALISEWLLRISQGKIRGLPGIFRYLYIGAGYVMLLWGLALVLPQAYISLGWFGCSVVYLSVGFVFTLPGYRWTGFGSIFVAVARIFLVDLATLEPIYRVLSFLIIGGGIILIAMIYTKRAQVKK